MSDKRKILIQLDPDRHASVFDRVVAVDSGVEELFSYENVDVESVTGLVHGAMFTRGPGDLRHTAIFVGGSDVQQGEAIYRRVQEAFFGPLRVSVMLDANGANTTSAAAVLAARRHLDLSGATALVLGGTGPVGQRAARLLAREGCSVRLASRSLERAERAAAQVNVVLDAPRVTGVETGREASTRESLRGAALVIAAGAAGVKLLDADSWRASDAQVLIDLNAVPPQGIEGVEVMDKAAERDGRFCYGAIGVGGMKMKIHRASVASLFESNDRLLDAEAIYELGKKM